MRLRGLLVVGVAWLVGGGSLVACGDDSATPTDAGSGSDGARADGGARDGGGGGGVCAVSSDPLNLTGQFGLLANLGVRLMGRSSALVALCPDPQMTTSQLLLKVDATQTGSNVALNVHVCDIQLPTVTGAAGSCMGDHIDISITPGMQLRTRLPTIANPMVTAGLAGTMGGSALMPMPFALTLGATGDTLPVWDATRTGCMPNLHGTTMACVTGADRLTDDDMDGHPAVTVTAMDSMNVLMGDAYVVIRVAPTLHGTAQSSNCIEGSVTATLDFSIVDSGVMLSGLPLDTPTVIQNIPPFEILDTSTFTMLRADGTGDLSMDDDSDGTVSCAELAAHRNSFE